MNLDWLVKKLQNYEIASADGTAIAAASAIKDLVRETKVKTPKKLLEEINSATAALRNARQSSAALLNSLGSIETASQNAFVDKASVKQMKKQVTNACEAFVQRIAEAKERIGEIGSKRIRSGDRLLTLCRSTTVLSILRQIAAQGKEIQVFVAESRPAFEGRLMANEVAELGLPVTLITDFAARLFLPDIDHLLAGGEAITANGAVVSKVGTATLAELSHEARVRVLIALGSYKFSRETIVGRLITLEEGDPEQVVPSNEIHPKVFVRNPLFDVTRSEHIDALITELGIIPPQGAYFLLKENQ